MKQLRTQIARRYRQSRDLLRSDGVTGLARRARRSACRWLEPTDGILEVRRADVVAADLSRPRQPVVRTVKQGDRTILNWVMTPPARGSGGHTTLFRILNFLQAHGHDNRVYFYDVYRADHRYFESVVRDYYGFFGPVLPTGTELGDAHGTVATSWNTAYAVFNATNAGRRFYFVQDFEPAFYPVGSLHLLAENTYRMGLHGITIGNCFADRLRTEYGMVVDSFEYGCDTTQYYRIPGVRRAGVVFYARPNAARRGFELGMMALEVLARRRPDIDIHIYGTRLGRLDFPFHDHGHISPAALNTLYNGCFAGLSLSFTNVSLVALEMLAAGCIPVTNESDLIKRDLGNSFVQYAPAHPHGLASALESLATRRDFDSLSERAAASIRPGTWDEAGTQVAAIIRRAITSQATAVLPPGTAAERDIVSSDGLLGLAAL